MPLRENAVQLAREAAVLGVWKILFRESPRPRVLTRASEGYPAVTRAVGLPSKWVGARLAPSQGLAAVSWAACAPVVLPEECPVR